MQQQLVVKWLDAILWIDTIGVRSQEEAMSLNKEEILLQTVSDISQWFISIFKNVKEILNALNLVICKK